MTGCYRCGLPEGSDERLCESCYRNRFHRGLLVVDGPSDGGATGVEMSPRVQRWVLSGGACFYVGIIGLALALSGKIVEVSPERLHRESIQFDGGYFPVDHEFSAGFIPAPLRE